MPPCTGEETIRDIASREYGAAKEVDTVEGAEPRRFVISFNQYPPPDDISADRALVPLAFTPKTFFLVVFFEDDYYVGDMGLTAGGDNDLKSAGPASGKRM